MPLVVRDTSLNPGVVNQDTSIFDYPNTPAPSILGFQVNPAAPLPDRTSTATGLLFPDLLLTRRLAAFPEEVWNLTPDSLLMRLMSVLLGPAGAGQLRQRQQVARLQGAISGTHFYDLDALYGALFSARRSSICALPLNPATGVTFDPYNDLATQDGWDDIHATDSRFRERVIQLARAISMGGTIPGIQAMAEAIVRVPCNVYETGQLMNLQGIETLVGLTWTSIQTTYPTWAAISGRSWNQDLRPRPGLPAAGGCRRLGHHGCGQRAGPGLRPGQRRHDRLPGGQPRADRRAGGRQRLLGDHRQGAAAEPAPAAPARPAAASGALHRVRDRL